MGSQVSLLNGLNIEEKAVEITDFWSHYHATFNDSCSYFNLRSDGSVSVFKGETVSGPLWTVSSPLEKYSNNLMKFRHPCIVKYISSWQQRSIWHLATEYVQPLSHVLSSQTPLQICIGLNNVLRALVFLHEQAGFCHNNVNISAIYVTGDGQWKLGGLQYLCSFNELTNAYLKHARIHRYNKAVDPNEDTVQDKTKVDQYAFSVLVDDVFKGCKDDEVPHLCEFKNYCKSSLQNNDPVNRPKLSEVLHHNFFNHEFITIYKFLNFIAVKSEDEKKLFFSNILDNLKSYEEVTVAKQFGGMLLSRLAMLDETARTDVIPFILKPKDERLHFEDNTGLFSLSVYKEHIKPRLLQLFGVRDGQIRMLLLIHFSKFINVFSHEELSQYILPELLLGIKDTDDNLVSATLLCLSELVPVLGAETVIGGKRSKIFTDGRPKQKNSLGNRANENVFPQKIIQDLPSSEVVYERNVDCIVYNTLPLKERLPPLGGEAEINNVTNNEFNNTKIPVREDEWSDWDNTDRQSLPAQSLQSNTSTDGMYVRNVDGEKKNVSRSILLQNAALEAKKNFIDISELDIKNQKLDTSKKNSDDFDFFADMQPVIEKASFINVVETSGDQSYSSKLNFTPDEDETWGVNWDE